MLTCNDCGRDINDCDRNGCREVRGTAWAKPAAKPDAVPSVKRKDFRTFALHATAEYTTLARSGFKREVFDLLNKAYRMGLHNGRINARRKAK